MDKYIGVRLVDAEYNKETNGYDIIYKNGHESWATKNVFEEAYLKVDKNINLPSDISISEDMVKAFIKDIECVTMGKKTTVVMATLVNDFVIVEASSCVDEKNYNEEMGKEICLNKIYDKIWELLGFLLQTAQKGIR